MKILLLTSLLLFSPYCFSQSFIDVTPPEMKGIYWGDIVWGDLNDDGWLDLIYTGLNEGQKFNVYKNFNGQFEKLNSNPDFASYAHRYYNILDLGDFNGDNKLDILITGREALKTIINDNFNMHEFDLDGPLYDIDLNSSSYWGDWDNDGDLDILYGGRDQFGNLRDGVILNNDSIFTWSVYLTSGWNNTTYAYWNDFNNDLDLDIIGSVSGQIDSTYLFKNNGDGTIIPIATDVPTYISVIEASDYDNDGDLDFAMAHDDGKIKIFNNQNSTFIDSQIPVPEAFSIKWGDINNDGNSDLLLGGSGYLNQEQTINLFINDKDKTFTEKLLDTTLKSQEAVISCADYDNDGDLDLAYIGGTQLEPRIKLYQNQHVEQGGLPNEAPTTPNGLTETVDGHEALLSWNPSTDAETPQKSLSYNVYIRKDNGTVITPAHADTLTGFRKIPKIGNAHLNTGYKIRCLQEGTYYWRVQAIDAGYKGSFFSEERSFTITNTAPSNPVNLIAKTISDEKIELHWEDASDKETEHLIYRKEVGSDIRPMLLNTLEANTTMYVDTFFLEHSTKYEYKVIAANCSYQYEFYSEASATTYPLAYELTNWVDLGEAVGTFALLGDYDNDMDLDLLLSYNYEYPDYGAYTKLFRFEGDHYEDTGIELPYISSYSAASWVDYDSDGFLDLFFTLGEAFEATTKLYKNAEGMGFIDTEINDIFSLEQLWQEGVAWGDYDNDGDPDILVQGTVAFTKWVIRIYENHGNGSFKDSGIQNIEGIIKSDYPWGDYDNDGDLDILVNKKTDCYNYTLGIYENNGDKSFKYVQLDTLRGLNDDLLNYTGDMEWGDYDNDGFLDIILSGRDACGNGSGITKLYKNNGNKSFSEIMELGIARGIDDVNVDWGDYDIDGDLDVFLYGDPSGGSQKTKVYKNNGNDEFYLTNINYLIQSIQYGTSTRGDIDNDGDLDLVILGEINYTTPSISIYKNNYIEGWEVANQQPFPPMNLAENIDNNNVILSWDKASDAETPQDGLTYNVYVIKDNADTIVVPNALQNGFRTIVGMGNAQKNTFFKLNTLDNGVYQWGVQAIDNTFAGSSFSTLSTFEINVPIPEKPSNLEVVITSDTLVSLTWQDNSEAENGFILERASSSDMNYQEIAVISRDTTNYTDSIAMFGQYFYRVKAFNNTGVSEPSNEVEISVITGIEDEVLKNEIFIYPNPAYSTLYLKAAPRLLKNIIIKLYTSNGRLIHMIRKDNRITHDEIEIDLSYLEKGLYFIQIVSENNFTIRKIIKE